MRYTPECETLNILGGARRRQLNTDHRLYLDDAGGDFDEPQAQRVEPAQRATSSAWADALRPHISQNAPACRNSRSWLAVAFVHEVRSAARCVFLDVIFGLAPPAVDILVKDTGVADLQVRDDEARVRPFRADFDACDDPLETVGPPNSKGGPKADPSRYPQIEVWEACGEFIHAAYTKRKDDDDFGQACTLVGKVMDDAQRDRLVSNVVGHLKNGATKPVLERALTANPS